MTDVRPADQAAADSERIRQRRVWELAETVAELERLLAEAAHRATADLLELAELRRDRDLKADYIRALEERVATAERRCAELDALLRDAEHRAVRAADDLVAERARLSYRVAQRLIAAVALISAAPRRRVP